ncbi:MAG: phosphatase PAP2 family protein [Candidatus Thorarchaeota archaeon]
MEKKERIFLIQICTLFICIILIIIILFIPFLFNFTLNQGLRNIFPGTAYFFRFITELGGTFIYLVIIFTIFWGIDKRIAKSLLMVYVSSNFVNYYAKAIIANERPPESQWLLIGGSHLSTPSGHAMSSTVVWGYLSMKTKRIAMWIISIIIIMLVGLSRIYLGVHWVGDVLTGWLFGMVILLFVYIFEEKIQDFINKYNVIYLYIGLAVLGLVVMILTDIIYQSSYNFGTPGGQMIGLGIGLALEHKYVNFEISYQPGEKWRIILRILIGILLIAIIYLGLYLVIDSDVLWLNALHYIVTLVLGIFLWPLIFTRIGL